MRAAIYARYSSERQNDASIEHQFEYCRDWAFRKGYEVVATYEDRALSGKVDSRPGFQRMVKESGKGLFDVLIVYKTDRFSRSRYDAAYYKRILKNNGVQVLYAAEEGLNTQDASSILLESVMEGMAEWYSANLSENVRRGQADNAQRGRFNGGRIPYAFDIVEGRYVPNEYARHVVMVFQMVASGCTYKDIETEMALHATDHKWRPSNIYQIIKNKKYKGTYTYKDVEIEGEIEPIVSPELWEAANRMIDGRKQSRSADYPLSGKLHDEHGKMVGTSATSRNGETYRYYICRECGKRTRKEHIERIVVKMVKDTLANPETCATIAQMMEDYLSEPEPHRRELEQAHKALERAVDAIIDNPTSPTLKARLAALEERVEALTEQVKRESRPKLDHEAIETWMKAYLLGVESPDHDKRLLRGFVNEVHIDGKAITIYLNYRDSLHKTDVYHYEFADADWYKSRMVADSLTHTTIGISYGAFCIKAEAPGLWGTGASEGRKERKEPPQR